MGQAEGKSAASSSSGVQVPGSQNKRKEKEGKGHGEGRDDAGEVHFGFDNYGNTCYCNSVLQALYHCQSFRREVLARAQSKQRSEAPVKEHGVKSLSSVISSATSALGQLVSGSDETSEHATLLDALTALFAQVDAEQRKAVAHAASASTSSAHPNARSIGPRSFVATLRRENALFRSYNQQDAQEFLIYLLNDIADTLEKEAKARGMAPEEAARTWVHATFAGTLTNEITCLMCESVTTREEPFLDLSIDLEQNHSLTACLRNFSKVEMLARSNKFHCGTCHALTEAHKHIRIKKLPRVLIVQLKRFKFVEELNRFTKLSHRIAYPRWLRIPNASADAAQPERLYALTAVVLHLGASPNSGHYLTIVRRAASTQWLVFDDDDVFPIAEAKLAATFGSIFSDDWHSVSASQTSYLLFYEQCDAALDELAASEGASE